MRFSLSKYQLDKNILLYLWKIDNDWNEWMEEAQTHLNQSVMFDTINLLRKTSKDLKHTHNPILQLLSLYR